MSQYLLQITHVNLTDIPPERTVTLNGLMDLDDDQAKALKKRAKKLFSLHSDGNDEYFTITLKKVDAVQPLSAEALSTWLDEFEKNELLTR
jgi:hypothetical protein